MKIFIMTDLEGCAGILNFEDWCIPSGRCYNQGLKILTEEINAAVAGFFEGGATEIIVCDGHGSGGIDPLQLDRRAGLMSAPPLSSQWPLGMDKSFHGLAVIGQHAKAGTDYSHITHTQEFSYVDLSINGLSIGEYGQMALCAMEAGVPAFFASGEDAFCREAEALTPGVVTVGTKRGLNRDGLDSLAAAEYMKAKLAAIHLSHAEACDQIHAGARRAILKLKKQPASFTYPPITPPYVRAVKLRATIGLSPRAVRDEHAGSIIALLNMPVPACCPK